MIPILWAWQLNVLINLNNFKLLAHRTQKYLFSMSMDWNVSALVTEPIPVNQALSRTNVKVDKISYRCKGHSVGSNQMSIKVKEVE